MFTCKGRKVSSGLAFVLGPGLEAILVAAWSAWTIQQQSGRKEPGVPGLQMDPCHCKSAKTETNQIALREEGHFGIPEFCLLDSPEGQVQSMLVGLGQSANLRLTSGLLSDLVSKHSS